MSRMIPVVVSAAGCALIAAVGTVGAEPHSSLPDGVAYVTSVEGIHEYALDNGMKVLLYPDPSQATITVNITYFVGSAHEGYGETGMAHLLEHLVFKGTPDHPDIPQELTAHGCRPNGTTWYDRTNYFETFAATDENLAWALDMEADRMVNSFIAKEDLDSEMSVVRNEFESGENDPLRILEERIYATAYIWHNYGNTTIGARSDIENVPIERLQAFYRKWYRPDNAMLVVAGKFEADDTLKLVAKEFGPIENPEGEVEPLYTSEPAQDGERTVTLRRVGDTQATAVGYHIPAGTHPDQPALSVLSYLLRDTPSGRLHKALIETGKAASIRGQADRFAAPGLLYTMVELREDQDIEEAERIMLEEIHAMANETPAEEDVERAKTALLRSWNNRMRNTRWSAISLSEWSSMGDWRSLFLDRDRLEAVTADDVARVAKAYIQESNRTIGRFIATDEPMRVEIPATENLAEALDGYTGREALAEGEDFDASPANIESRLTRMTLPSGLDVVMMPKRTRGGVVNVSLNLHHGTEEALTGKQTAAGMAGGMLMRGTTTRSRQDIADEIDRLDASIWTSGWTTGAGAGIETKRENLDAALDLVADMLKNPAFDEDEFEQLRRERLLRIEAQMSEPRSKSWTALGRHLDAYEKGHPFYTSTPEEDKESVTAVSLDEAKQFHREFYGASSGELVVVGDFDPDAVRGRIESLFGDWVSSAPYERISTGYAPATSMVDRIKTPDKESAVMAAGMNVEINQDHADYPAMALGNFMTGGGFLNSRLATRIRRQEGISYGIGSRLNAPSYTESTKGKFTVFAIYAPENDQRIMRCLREEIERITSEGFSADEVEEAKSGWLQQQVVARSDEGELAGRLARRQQENKTLAWDEDLERRVATLTVDDINAAFRRHISFDKMSVIRAGDFAEEEVAEAP